MTKEELEQFIDLQREIKELEKKIISVGQQETDRTKDKVKASYSEFPYIQGNAVIEGIDKQAEERKRKRIRNIDKLLQERKQRAEKEKERIIKYINDVKKSKIRRIMEYKYIEGYTWEKIAYIMNCDRTYPEKLVSKYLKENEDK